MAVIEQIGDIIFKASCLALAWSFGYFFCIWQCGLVRFKKDGQGINIDLSKMNEKQKKKFKKEKNGED